MQVVSRSAVAVAVVQESLPLEPAARTLLKKALVDTTMGDTALSAPQYGSAIAHLWQHYRCVYAGTRSSWTCRTSVARESSG